MIDQVPPYLVEDRRMLSRIAGDRSKPNISTSTFQTRSKEPKASKQTYKQLTHFLSLNLIHSE
jgi:hypothetical protein